jgi:hypothetical protein
MKNTDCSLIRTHKFLGSLLENLNAGQGTTGLSAFARGYARNLLTRAGEYIGLLSPSIVFRNRSVDAADRKLLNREEEKNNK